MNILVYGHEFKYDLTSMSMLFFPGEQVVYAKAGPKQKQLISRVVITDAGKCIIKARLNLKTGKVFRCIRVCKNQKEALLNAVKQTAFIVLSKATGLKPPFGIMTGIRPLSVYIRLINEGQNAVSALQKEYYMSAKKAQLLDEIYKNQQVIYRSEKKGDISLYISIPFCPSKCSYCSFISVAATKNNRQLIDNYLKLLYNEITLKLKLISEFGKGVSSVYIGGGTPGILDENLLKELICHISDSLDLSSLKEYTCEIGRPDTVTPQKLEILKSGGVTRVCINTQSTNDAILSKIGRNHTFIDYQRAMDTALGLGFKSINTDLIAGLPSDTVESFLKSLSDIITLGADNITVHTLAIKRASQLSQDLNNFRANSEQTEKMIDYSYNLLKGACFMPYYIYKQKNAVSNSENIGYAKSGKFCFYNVEMMEDLHTVIACGAGASSKFINGGRTDRIINVKYPFEYVNEYEKVLDNIKKTRKMLEGE